MGGFRLDRLNDDARQTQELHDIDFGVLDRTSEDANKPKRGFVNGHRRGRDLRPASERLRQSVGLWLSGDVSTIADASRTITSRR